MAHLQLFEMPGFLNSEELYCWTSKWQYVNSIGLTWNLQRCFHCFSYNVCLSNYGPFNFSIRPSRLFYRLSASRQWLRPYVHTRIYQLFIYLFIGVCFYIYIHNCIYIHGCLADSRVHHDRLCVIESLIGINIWAMSGAMQFFCYAILKA